MTFEEFSLCIKEYLEEIYPNGNIVINRVTKNNGVIYSGVTISDNQTKIAPTIYLESFYEMFLNGTSLENIKRKIRDVYSCRKIDYDLDFDFFSEFEKVKNKLKCKLVNVQSNREYLKNVPHELFLDLAIVPYCYLSEEEFNGKIGGGSITINNKHVSMWGVNAKEVLYEAKRNTFMNKPSIENLYEVLCRINPKMSDEFQENRDFPPMYILGATADNGAVYMTDLELLRGFCDKIESDVYIIPSSVHEVLLIPVDGTESESMLNEMIADVNKTELEPVEVLSNHAYYFSRNTGFESRIAV